MDQVEARHPVTSLATVSCRTDLLEWYGRRGYKRVEEMPLDQVSYQVLLEIICNSQNVTV